jgi:hypothetical protein
MGLIERWTMSECPDCGVLTCATAEQVQWCDEHCRSDKTVVEVVRADAHRGAVSALQSIYDHHHMNGDGSAGQVSSDALRALGIDPDAGEQ